MNRYIAAVVFTLMTLFLAIPSAHLHASELKPLVVLIEKAGNKAIYKVNGKPTAMPMMIDATAAYLSPSDPKGLKTKVFVLTDDRLSQDVTENMTGLLEKVGFQNIRYFGFDKKYGMMNEIKFVGPAIPITTDPQELAKIEKRD
jgi:hypothetical protein